MSGIQVQRKFIFNIFRNIQSQSGKFCTKATQESVNSNNVKNVENQETKQTLPPGSSQKKSGAMRQYRDLRLIDKWLLVWFKKYKSVKDVPSRIPYGELDHIHDKSRIRIGNILMVLGLIICAYGYTSGKQSAKEGDSLEKRIQERHKKAREEYLQSQQQQQQQSKGT